MAGFNCMLAVCVAVVLHSFPVGTASLCLFKITVQDAISGKLIIKLDNVIPSDLVSDVKATIAEQKDIPPEKQYMTFNGTHLENSHNLAYYKIAKGSTILLSRLFEITVKDAISRKDIIKLDHVKPSD
eukprot:208152_1